VFYDSLMREATGLDKLVDVMQGNEPPNDLLAEEYGEWRYWTARRAVEKARCERSLREEWAKKFPDMRCLVLQKS